MEEGTGSGSKNSSGDNHHHININHATTGGGSKSLLDSANSSDDKGIGIRPGIVGSSTASFAPGYSHSNNNSVSGVGEDQGGGLLPGLKLRLPGHDNMAASSSSSASMMMLQQQGMHMLPGKRASENSRLAALRPSQIPKCLLQHFIYSIRGLFFIPAKVTCSNFSHLIVLHPVLSCLVLVLLL